MPRPKIDEIDLKLRIAEVIYNKCSENKLLWRVTNKEIHKALKDVSESKVSELRDDAIKEYLRVTITRKFPKNEKLQTDLFRLFNAKGFKKAIVVNKHKKDSLLEALGLTAARYFEEHVEPGETIVLSCGATINSMVNNINVNKNYDDLKVYSSIVLCVDSFQKISPPVLINNFSQRFPEASGYAYQIPEAILDKLNPEELRKKLANKVFEEALRATHFFLGIGSLSKKSDDGFSAGFNSLVESLESYDAFKAMGCCGEISHCPVLDKEHGGDFLFKRKDGSDFIKTKFFDRVFTIDFKKMIERKKEHNPKRTVVAVAGGKNKVPAISVCLKMDNFIDVLITDAETAQGIIKYNEV